MDTEDNAFYYDSAVFDAVVEEFILEVLGVLGPDLTLLLSAKYDLTHEQLQAVYDLVQNYFS
jgi:hypothetical protein